MTDERKEILTHATKRIKLEDIMLIEIMPLQKEKNILYDAFYMSPRAVKFTGRK